MTDIENNISKFYRYNGINFYEGRSKVDLDIFFLIKETPKGYWIGNDWLEKKWVSGKTRKRFAYPTKKEALNSFIARKKRQIKILDSQLHNAKIYLDVAENMKEDFND